MSNNDFRTPYQKWQDGDISAHDALRELTASYASIEETLDGWQQQKDAARAEIDKLVSDPLAGFGSGKVEMGGFEISQIEATQTGSYDTRQLDGLVAELLKSGNVEVAQKITECRKFTTRRGYIRVARQKA